MAFLLSPKTGGGAVSYAFAVDPQDIPVSINGAPEQVYTTGNPGTVHPGDVLGWLSGTSARVDYYGDPNKEPLFSSQSTSPYTVQSIEGATILHLDIGRPI